MLKNFNGLVLSRLILVSFLATGYAFAVSNLILPAKAEAGAKFRTHIINIKSSAFSRKVLTIRKGDTVIWRNTDIVPHTTTGRGFDSGNLNKGQSWKFVFRKKGTFPYICTYHPSMKGKIIVR